MALNQYLSILLLAITGCLLYIAYLAWRKREWPSARSLAICLFGGALYSFGYAFEMLSSDLEQINFWLRVEYIGISFSPSIWFIMVLQYTSRRVMIRKWMLALLSIIPTVTLLSEYTNKWHHLFYKTMDISMAMGFPLASTTPGPLYILHVIYAYILVVIGMGMLIRMFLKASAHLKKQVLFMIIGSFTTYAITLIYLMKILKTPIDFSPFGFLLLGIFYMWGIYQFNMLELVPQALKRVFNSMRDAVIVFDLDHNITSFNQSAKQIFQGLNNKKVIGLPLADILTPYPELLEVIERGTAIQKKIKIEHPFQKFYQMNISDVFGKNANAIGKMLLLTDITESVLAEEKLVANAKQLSELNAFKDKMFNVIAHDIRDPLSILVNLMEVFRDELKTFEKSHDEIVDAMDQQIQNTFSIAENLLDWFRSQEKGLLFNPIEWNLFQAVQRNVSLLNIKSERKHIEIKSQIPKDLTIYGDKEMIDLIIRNLLSNAVKFTRTGGTIYLNASQVDSKVIVSIKDNGVGISSEKAKTLFADRQSQSASTIGTAGERGIGLGLILCRQFARINDGDLWFESFPNKGSVFYFSVPATST